MSEKEDSQGFVKAIAVGALSTLLGTGLLWMFGLGEKQAPVVVQAVPGTPTPVTPVSVESPERPTNPRRRPGTSADRYADDYAPEDEYYGDEYYEDEYHGEPNPNPDWADEPKSPNWPRMPEVSGIWQGNDGLVYAIQTYGGQLAISGTHPQMQIVTLTGNGTIYGSTIDLYYTMLDGSAGRAQLEVSPDGQRMAGSYINGAIAGQIQLRR